MKVSLARKDELHLIHSDDVHEVVCQGRCKSADLAGIEQQGDGVCGMGHHAVIGENDHLEEGVVCCPTHVGQGQGGEELGGNLSMYSMPNHLQTSTCCFEIIQRNDCCSCPVDILVIDLL